MSDKRLQDNLARWGQYRPGAAKQVAEVSDSEMHFCKAESGVDNLYKLVDGHPFFYHSSTDPVNEANEWFSEQSSNKVEILFIYGIGLGYHYKAALSWLRANERRCLVFIEDDLQVIRSFFKTETATELLLDRQVFLDYISYDNNLSEHLEELTLIYSFRKCEISALKAYLDRPSYPMLKSQIEFFTISAKKMTSEYILGSPSFYTNFLSNILETPYSFQAEKMFGKFAGIPAIICGAGPSLGKNIDLIGSLKDRALIFAGGSALNALNAHGIDPHFGLGVDPNPTQITRLIANQAYETPFFYRTRMCHESLDMVHGDKIFVARNGGHQISEWFEKNLDISGSYIPPGHNVLNLSLSLAKLLGCNPILVAGADLAYSQGESYSVGVVNHPIHDLKRDFRTKSIEDELLHRTDIYGKPVDTTWKWIFESLWYHQIAQKESNLTIVNVTEGGIGFPHIPNMTLAEAATLFIPPSSDLFGRVLGVIHNSVMPSSATSKEVTLWMEKYLNSLDQCILHCQKIEKVINKLNDELTSKEDALPDPQLIEEWKKEDNALNGEDAYVNDLEEMSSAYLRSVAIELQRLLFDRGVKQEKEIKLAKLKIDKERYLFLNRCAVLHTHIIKQSLSRYHEDEAKDLNWFEENGNDFCDTLKKEYPIPHPNVEDVYSFEDGKLIITDAELGISFHENADAKSVRESVSLKYPSGALQMKSFYKDGALHGPSIAYAEDGSILVHSWFWQGKRQGKMWSYYKSGQLHSLQQFLNGKLEGIQKYFYENALPKTEMTYRKGMLDGEVILWHRNGHKARQLSYIQGKKDGKEKFWDKHGILRIEAHYREGKPVGTAKVWDQHGQQKKEIEYDENSNRSDEKIWDKTGSLVTSEIIEKKDYFDDVTGQALKLTDSIETIYKHVSEIIPLVASRDKEKVMPSNISQDLEELKQEMERLQSLADSLQQVNLGQGRHNEAIWKTPSTQNKLEKQIETLGAVVNKGLFDIQGNLKNLFKKIQEEDNPPSN